MPKTPEQLEAQREAVRRYRARNRDHLNARHRLRMKTDPDYREKRIKQIRTSVSKWREQNREKAKAATKTWYDKNIEYCRKKARAYYKTNKVTRQTYSKKRYKREREKCLAIMKAQHKKTKDMVFDAYGGYKCACKKCQERNPKFLTIDHINGCSKQLRKKQGLGSQLYRWLKKNSFPTGYRVLCFNCNIGRANNHGIVRTTTKLPRTDAPTKSTQAKSPATRQRCWSVHTPTFGCRDTTEMSRRRSESTTTR